MNNNEENEEENSGHVRQGREASFVGLRSPDHLKKVCNMFRNQDFKA